MSALYHGGVPGLRVGDTIEPGHTRDNRHPGCPWCEARANGTAHQGIDGPSQRPDRVYATTNRLYAKHHASLYGRGDLYRVAPTETPERSTEDSIESYTAPRFVVVSVLDRAVLLTNTERRRLSREWTTADHEAQRPPRPDVAHVFHPVTQP